MTNLSLTETSVEILGSNRDIAFIQTNIYNEQ